MRASFKDLVFQEIMDKDIKFLNEGICVLSNIVIHLFNQSFGRELVVSHA